MAKTKKITVVSEEAFTTGTDALKLGLEQAVKKYEAIVVLGKDTVDAYVESATVARTGLETIQAEIYAYSQQSVDASVAAGKALIASKSIHEALELQTTFAKDAFESYVTQFTKISELFSSSAKHSFAPLKERADVFAESVQALAAA